jgi:hypothetical protein
MVVRKVYLKDSGIPIINSTNAIKKAKFSKSKYTSPRVLYDGVIMSGKRKGMVVYKVYAQLKKR